MSIQTNGSLFAEQTTVENRRLLWELQTINEIADGISRSLELDDVLTGALQRIVKAFDAVGASIRLLDEAAEALQGRRLGRAVEAAGVLGRLRRLARPTK